MNQTTRPIGYRWLPSRIVPAITSILLGLLLAPVSAQPASSPTGMILARQFPVESLRQILIARSEWKPFPRFEDRQAWGNLPAEERRHLVELGERALAKAFPLLPASRYLEYARNGNRSRYEAIYFDRRHQLHALVLAECVEAKGRFLDAAADALWAICEESSWCIPAHVGAQKAGVGLPDTTEPIVDLFAGETGVSVSWTLYLLGRELGRVSPQIPRRAERELEQRILAPVLQRDNFGWMALNVTHPDRRPNNWTPWIAASVLTAALTSETDPEKRVLITHKMLRSIDGFLKFHPADGGCDEGPGYWGRAGASLLDCLDLLHSATGGKLDVFDQPLIQEIGRFILRARIAGDYYAPIGDCPARMTPDRTVLFRYGKRIDDSALMAMAAEGASASSVLEEKNTMGRLIYAVFDFPALRAIPPAPVPYPRDVWLPSDDMQFMAARPGEGEMGLYLAAWGAHNAQSHNHNDVGNFLVFANGQPVFIDVGAPTYTAQTFSGRRYEIWAFQSGFHNLPTINGVMQSAGRAFAARDVKYQADEKLAELRMDLAPAYPPSAQVSRWLRTLRLNRSQGQSIEITDTFELKETSGPTAQNLITPMSVDASQPGKILLRSAAGEISSPARVRLDYDPHKLSATVETIELTDARLKRSWGDRLHRIILKASRPAEQDSWTLKISLD